MKTYRWRILIALGAALVLTAAMAACTGTAPPQATAAPTPAEEMHEEQESGDHGHEEGEEHAEEMEAGDPVRGGLLYDKWWAVLAAEAEQEAGHAHDDHGHEGGAPEGDHPLWSTQSTNSRSGADTWRCKECHGWDYKGADGVYGAGSHFTGFPGILGLSGEHLDEILAALKGSTNPNHDFSDVLSEHDLIDLATFISQALLDTDEFLSADGNPLGVAAGGEDQFTEVCQLCHGPDGVAINFHGVDEPEYVPTVAQDNPWEFIHKIRFGQPGAPMPSAIKNEWSHDDIANVLAYAAALPAEPGLNQGGQMYDNWWVTLELDEPNGDMPLWATQSSNERSGSDTWRCKECHGWDYKGAEGAYGSGSHFTGFGGILGSNEMTADELIAWLDGTANPDHDFSPIGDLGISALVMFIQEEVSDVGIHLDAQNRSLGDPAAGEEMFEGTCAACHGTDGRKINFHDADEPEYIGTIARENPWEFLHKDSFGHPGTHMPAGLYLGWTLEQLADLLAYAQTLPAK